MPDERLPADMQPADWRETFNEWQQREIDRAEYFVKTLGYHNIENTSYGIIYRLVQSLDASRHQAANLESSLNLQLYIAKRKAELGEPAVDPDDTQELFNK